MEGLCHYIPDKRRSAFGLGYEYARRGREITDNPFPPDSRRFRWFQEGFQAYNAKDKPAPIIDVAAYADH